MRPLPIVLALAGLAVVVLSGPALRSHFSHDRQPVAEPAPDVAVAPVAPAPAAPPAGEPSNAPVPVLRPLMPRPVAPDVVAAPPIPTDALERVEARDPLGDKGRALSPADLPPAETILRRPVVNAAGTFTSQGHTVALAGIVVTDAGRMCGEGAAAWPCGIHARTAFRNYLRGRALTCVVPAMPGSETVVADCKVGTQNPAEWLVAQGWVRAEAGGPYEEAGTAAEAAQRGLFGSAPVAAPALTITVPDAAVPPTSAVGVPSVGSGG